MKYIKTLKTNLDLFQLRIINKKIEIKHIPNILTISRFVFALLSCFSLYYSYFALSTFIFFIACITDYLDGYLARKWAIVSDFGKIFDPIADKSIIIVFLFFFMYQNYCSRFLLFILILRDIVCDFYRLKFYKKDIITPAIKFAKYKTIFQIIFIIIMMLFTVPRGLANFLILFPVVLAYISGYKYLKNYWNISLI